MATSNRARTAAERRARVEQMRREQRAKERRQTLIISVVGGVVILAILGVIIAAVVHNKTGVTAQRHSQSLPADVDRTAAATTEPAATTVPNTTGIPGVVAYATNGWPQSSKIGPAGKGLPHNHLPGPISYTVTPPVGGDHNSQWMNCGVYVDPVVTERAVHNLEHGAIWITYEPSILSSERSQLQAFVEKQSKVDPLKSGRAERYMDLSPWKDNTIGSPIVLSAWGYQLKVSSASDPRMQQFVDKFRANPTYTPEYGGACSGTSANIGGQPVED